MALITLSPNETAGVFGAVGLADIFGTAGSETVVIDGNGNAILDGSFSAGGDTIKIEGNAADYTATINGSNVVLTSAGGANIVIPFGTAGATIEFADATRTLQLKSGELCIGDQVIGDSNGDSAPVEAGSNGSGGGGGGSDDEQFLTANQDVLEGTNGNSLFYADVVQVNGLQVNSMGTGDRVDGNGGADRLEAQATRGSTYGDGNAPIQPRVNNVETITIEALQSDLAQTNLPISLTDLIETDNNTLVFVNASDIRGHNEIWSYESKADLIIQDVTTIVADGGHDNNRNTEALTIGMAYSRSDNHQWDASDFEVYLDPDFLLSGVANQAQAIWFALDQDAAQAGDPLLNNINIDGIQFTVDGVPVELRDPNAQLAGNHNNFVAELQDELDALIALGVLPADTTLTVQLGVEAGGLEDTFLDDGTFFQDIPAIVLETNTATELLPTGFTQVEDAIGEYNFYGRFTNEAEVDELPITINIALEKAGNGVIDCCDAGEMIVGSMDKDNSGIEVFKVIVYGDDSRPSTLARLDSTGGVLNEMYIASDNAGFPNQDKYADLTIGDTNSGMELIDASEFKGDNLQLGSNCKEEDFNPKGSFDAYRFSRYDTIGAYVDLLLEEAQDQIDGQGIDIPLAELIESFFVPGCERIVNLQMLDAVIDGNVTYYGDITLPNAFTYNTGGGDDLIDLWIDGDALDYASSSLRIDTGGGNDTVITQRLYDGDGDFPELPNHVILDNIDIFTGAGNDVIRTLGSGNERIDAGSGNDTIYTGNEDSKPVWVFNTDPAAMAAGGWSVPGDLPGVPNQLSLLDGGIVRVTFSGAGLNNDGSNGGGAVGELTDVGDDASAAAFINGYESTAVINVGPPFQNYGNQTDINNAILEAINNDPVLNKLLKAEIGSNNTLVVYGCVDGYYEPIDLDIEILPPNLDVDASGNVEADEVPASVLADLRLAGIIDSDNILLSDFGPLGAIGDDLLVDVTDANRGTILQLADPTADAFYDGVDVPRQISMGSRGNFESDTVITPGAGMDVTVLSTDNVDFNSQTIYMPDVNNNYTTLNGYHYDGASNETIVLSGVYGDDYIFNFMTFYGPDGSAGPVANVGFDFLDYTSHLQSSFSTSGSTQSTQTYAVTLDDYSQETFGTPPAEDNSGIDVTLNEVVIFDFDDTGADASDTFAGLDANDIRQVILNNDSYGSLNSGGITLEDSFTNNNTPGGPPPMNEPNPGSGQPDDEVVGGTGYAILKVQNLDNLGEYKDFLVTWDAIAGTGDPDDWNVAVLEIGMTDFGASLYGFGEENLVGSNAYAMLG